MFFGVYQVERATHFSSTFVSPRFLSFVYFTVRCILVWFGSRFNDGETPICYLSRSLTRTERNLSTTEKECLCVIWAVEKLRHYLEGTRFVVITDHHSLLWLHRLKDPQGRLARWALRLQPYDFEIKHRPGKTTSSRICYPVPSRLCVLLTLRNILAIQMTPGKSACGKVLYQIR
jgi:hypothetical protein